MHGSLRDKTREIIHILRTDQRLDVDTYGEESIAHPPYEPDTVVLVHHEDALEWAKILEDLLDAE